MAITTRLSTNHVLYYLKNEINNNWLSVFELYSRTTSNLTIKLLILAMITEEFEKLVLLDNFDVDNVDQAPNNPLISILFWLVVSKLLEVDKLEICFNLLLRTLRIVANAGKIQKHINK